MNSLCFLSHLRRKVSHVLNGLTSWTLDNDKPKNIYRLPFRWSLIPFDITKLDSKERKKYHQMYYCIQIKCMGYQYLKMFNHNSLCLKYFYSQDGHRKRGISINIHKKLFIYIMHIFLNKIIFKNTKGLPNTVIFSTSRKNGSWM